MKKIILSILLLTGLFAESSRNIEGIYYLKTDVSKKLIIKNSGKDSFTMKKVDNKKKWHAVGIKGSNTNGTQHYHKAVFSMLNKNKDVGFIHMWLDKDVLTVQYKWVFWKKDSTSNPWKEIWVKEK